MILRSAARVTRCVWRWSTVSGVRDNLWPLARRYFFDAVVLVGAAAAVIELLARRGEPDVPTRSFWVVVPLLVLIFLPVLARRQFPFGALALAMLGCAAVSFVDGRLVVFGVGVFLLVLSLAFLFGMLEDGRQAVAGIAIALAAGAVVVRNDPSGGADDFGFIAILLGACWLAGFALGRKMAEAKAVEAKAARLEAEREERARAAVAEERARIARELHDVVGHSVSVMTVQAAAVRRLLHDEQEREREALIVVEQTGREALAEMRRMVGVLRRPEEAPALAPQPSLEHLDKLVQQVREAGLPVALRIEGEAGQLPAGVDLTAYRLVQEGLTNALKHARAGHAEVVVRYGSDDVEVVVTDDGKGVGAGKGEGGHGLMGIRERVTVYGGELEAGPRPEGGYALRARLPVGAA